VCVAIDSNAYRFFVNESSNQRANGAMIPVTGFLYLRDDITRHLVVGLPNGLHNVPFRIGDL
jgi:hypothetical protein